MKLSIIVPCYNVEEYVEKCIVSLENQDIPQEDYEILAYNDESKDNTLDILFNLHARHHDLPAAPDAANTKIHAYAQNLKFVAAAGVIFFHYQSVAHSDIHIRFLLFNVCDFA